MLLGFTIYSAAMYGYFIPSTTMSTNRICVTVAMNAVVIIVLWSLYRKKEKMAEKRDNDDVSLNNK